MSSSSDQYRIIGRAAGWMARTWRGWLRVEGRDAPAFLHNLLSNDIASLAPGQGAYATYLTPQGRMIADVAVYRLSEHLWLDVPRAEAARLADQFDALVFTEDVRVSDESEATAILTVVGETAARAVAAAVQKPEHEIESLTLRSHFTVGDRFVARTDEVDGPAFDVVTTADDAAAVMDALATAGAIALDEEMYEALRIDAGRPRFGLDMTGETIPLEAGLLDRAISQTKGCYVGQEVIVRVLHRGSGRVARRLVRLRASGGGDPIAAGARITMNGMDVGHITSAAFSPRLDRIVALGYLKRDAIDTGGPFIAAGTPVELAGTV